MSESVEGVYRDGHVELLETPTSVEEARVIVTFLEAGRVDLRQRGLDEAQAEDLRGRLHTFAEDWNRPEMDAYDAL